MLLLRVWINGVDIVATPATCNGKAFSAYTAWSARAPPWLCPITYCRASGKEVNWSASRACSARAALLRDQGEFEPDQQKRIIRKSAGAIKARRVVQKLELGCVQSALRAKVPCTKVMIYFDLLLLGSSFNA